MSTGSLFTDGYRKLVAGTEVLRTGGGANLSAGECNATLDELGTLRSVLSYLADEAARACTEPRMFHESAVMQQNLAHCVSVARQAVEGKLPEQGNDPSKRLPEDAPR